MIPNKKLYIKEGVQIIGKKRSLIEKLLKAILVLAKLISKY